MRPARLQVINLKSSSRTVCRFEELIGVYATTRLILQVSFHWAIISRTIERGTRDSSVDKTIAVVARSTSLLSWDDRI